VAAEDGWQSAIHGCKEDGKNRRLAKEEEEEGCRAKEKTG
jgi:hypothetical protein